MTDTNADEEENTNSDEETQEEKRNHGDEENDGDSIKMNEEVIQWEDKNHPVGYFDGEIPTTMGFFDEKPSDAIEALRDSVFTDLETDAEVDFEDLVKTSWSSNVGSSVFDEVKTEEVAMEEESGVVNKSIYTKNSSEWKEYNSEHSGEISVKKEVDSTDYDPSKILVNDEESSAEFVSLTRALREHRPGELYVTTEDRFSLNPTYVLKRRNKTILSGLDKEYGISGEVIYVFDEFTAELEGLLSEIGITVKTGWGRV